MCRHCIGMVHSVVVAVVAGHDSKVIPAVTPVNGSAAARYIADLEEGPVVAIEANHANGTVVGSDINQSQVM